MAYGITIAPVTNTLFTAAEDRRAAQVAQDTNSGQIATISLTYLTIGSGGIQADNFMSFDSTFVSEPAFTTGAALLDGNGVTGGMLVSAGVVEWLRDSAGYYIGCKVWATVTGGTQGTKVLHTFTFNGIAIKKLPVIEGDLAGPIPGRIPSAAKVIAY